MSYQIEQIDMGVVEEGIKKSRFITSLVKPGDVINNCIFISHEGFDIGKVGGEFLRLGKFKCPCGNEFITRISSVHKKHTNSCGCYNKRRVLEANTTHKLSKHPLYHTWDRMIKRCYKEGSQDYKNYGERGISVCERWKDINSFIEDMYPTYSKELSIDRIDNDGNYEPSNCRWATAKIQTRNRRSTRYFPYNGGQISMVEYCEINNLSYDVINKRVNGLNWSIERAMATEIRPRKKKL